MNYGPIFADSIIELISFKKFSEDFRADIKIFMKGKVIGMKNHWYYLFCKFAEKFLLTKYGPWSPIFFFLKKSSSAWCLSKFIYLACTPCSLFSEFKTRKIPIVNRYKQCIYFTIKFCTYVISVYPTHFRYILAKKSYLVSNRYKLHAT